MSDFLVKLEQALISLTEAPSDFNPRHRRGRARPAINKSSAAIKPIERETSKYSLRFRFDDTVLAMSEVEGMAAGPYDDAKASAWLDQQYSGKPGTAVAAQRKIKELIRLSSGDAVDMDDGMAKIAVINGIGGNRWSVYLNGMVVFDARYASSGGAIRKATELGFDVE